MDDIHRPESVCKEAQELAAEAFGADRTYFLVNGSSCGNHAMMMAALRPGEQVLMARNSHRSAMGGLLLAGAEAVFFEPPYDPEMRVFQAPTLDIVAQALEKNPQSKAIFFTSPTYYGSVADSQSLVDFAHERGLTVLVDEAWGAHLAFHPALPPSAVAAGADLVVQSTHKMVGGLTQTAMLHANGERVERSRLESVLRMLQSTSPSCLFLASLDATRRQLALRGEQDLGLVLELATSTRVEIDSIEQVRCFGRSAKSGHWDPTRLTISARERGYSGYELELYLREEHNIQVELSDFFNVIALFSLGHTREHSQRLIAALKTLPRRAPLKIPETGLPRPRPLSKLTPGQAFQARHETVSVESASDRISAEMLTTYPPGIPLICPGELFSKELLDYIRVEHEAGSRIEGAHDPSLRTVRVIQE